MEDVITKEEMDNISKMMVDDATKYPNDNWDNYLEMLKDMKEHAALNGGAIIQADRPMQLRIAYRCMNTGKTWSCKITNIKRDYIESKDKNLDALLKMNCTKEDKENLLAVINGK